MGTSVKSRKRFPNPPGLSPRYEIRQLVPDDASWVAGLIAVCLFYHSPLLSKVICDPKERAAGVYKMYETTPQVRRKMLADGLSFAIFDNEYRFKHAKSIETGGRIWWDTTNTDVTEQDLLDQLDIPMVSIVLAFDSFDADKKLSLEDIQTMSAALPVFRDIDKVLQQQDGPDTARWMPTAKGQVMRRAGTDTMPEYMGQGFMTILSHFLIEEARSRGYRSIMVKSASDSISRVWRNPPAPATATLVRQIDPGSYTIEDKHGRMVKPFAPATQILSQFYVDL